MRNNEAKISPETQENSRRDIELLESVQAGLIPLNSFIVLDSGYAVEAVTGGEIIRPHDDLDIMTVGFSQDIPALTETLLACANSVDNSAWVSLPTKSNWLWLQTQKQDKHRQLNVHVLHGDIKDSETLNIVPADGLKYLMPVVFGDLTVLDKTIKILCPSLEFLVTSKIRLVEPYGNNPRPKDLQDLRRMINHPLFSISKYLEILSEYYVARKKYVKDEAIIKARKELLKFLPPV